MNMFVQHYYIGWYQRRTIMFEQLSNNNKKANRVVSHRRKRTDGLHVTLVQRQNGKSLCWDVTVICSLVESYVTGSARETGAVAELAASRKEEKYASIGSEYLFAPIAVETFAR